MNSSKIKILVATHKRYWMPKSSIYLPVFIGAHNAHDCFDYQRDDCGENISYKNPYYCELTALYWAWKNLDADYIGLTHYRRHFAGSGENGVLTNTDAVKLLSDTPVLLPKARNYIIESIGSHYAHTFDAEHLTITRNTLQRIAPAYVAAYDDHLKETRGHMWNMFIMRKDIFDAWCSWLFPILADIEQSFDFESMSPFEKRVMGRISELLLDPWLTTNHYDSKDIPIKELEKPNWINKGWSFLMAKYCGKKYTESF